MKKLLEIWKLLNTPIYTGERLRENLAAGEITLTAAEIADIDSRLDGMEFDVFGGHSGK